MLNPLQLFKLSINFSLIISRTKLINRMLLIVRY